MNKSGVQGGKGFENRQLQANPTPTNSENFPSSGVGELGPPPQKPEITFVPGTFQPRVDFTIDPEKTRLIGEEENNQGADLNPTGSDAGAAGVPSGPMAALTGGGCSLGFAPLTTAGLAEGLASAIPWILGLAGLLVKNRRHKMNIH